MSARVTSIQCTLGRASWAFADFQREQITSHFNELRAANPSLWNGEVLMMTSYSVRHDVLCGEFIKTDFASVKAWRDWGWPEAGVLNCFAMTALRSNDGAIIGGVMNEWTVTPGMVCLPGGMPEARDVCSDNTIDFEGNVAREFEEETGVSLGNYECDGRWFVVRHGPRLMLGCLAQSSKDANTLIGEMTVKAVAPKSEFSEIVAIRNDSHNHWDRMHPCLQQFLYELRMAA